MIRDLTLASVALSTQITIKKAVGSFTSCNYAPVNQIACVAFGLLGLNYAIKASRSLFNERRELFAEHYQGLRRRGLLEENAITRKDLLILQILFGFSTVAVSSLLYQEIQEKCW